MANIAYADLTSLLLQRLPELREEYLLERESWKPDDVPPHLMCGSVLPRLLDRLEAACRRSVGNEDEKILNRAFILVEEMATSRDFETRCTIEASLLETLLGESDGWQRFSRFFHPETMRMAERVNRRFEG
ncbi:MAG: hypothetical protein KDA65_06945 [Planctomycetaceae bacterium]|nr:hypothetical protein [Planctomycetaceae bacterium]